MSINPHEGNELALLLAGTKPVARLCSEPSVNFIQDLTAYEPHVASGRLIRVDTTEIVHTPDGREVPIIYHYFCLPTEEWRIKLMEVMNDIMKRPDKGGFTTPELHRIDGYLLGYAKADIEAFIVQNEQWWNENRQKLDNEASSKAE